MREIKFRGKRIDNGEWIYGSLVQINCHDSRDYVVETQIVLSNGHVFLVDPETVGQFIGFKDKDEEDIYEGDILSDYNDDPDSEHFLVEWGYFQDCCVSGMGFNLYDGSVFTPFFYSDTNTISAKIIGNKCENPELLTNQND